MECPECNNDKRMRIVETRHNKADNETMRLYICEDCGRQYFAIDTLVVNPSSGFIDEWRYWNRTNTRARYKGGNYGSGKLH